MRWLPCLLSLAVMAVIIALAVQGDLPVLSDSRHQWTPFVFTYLGVTLYVLQAAQRRREGFDLRYVPDYFYRGAQAAVYLYVIMTLFARGQPHEFASWPPNLVGAFVGLYIEQVEAAMQGLGQRFEQAVAVLLPRTRETTMPEHRRVTTAS